MCAAGRPVSRARHSGGPSQPKARMALSAWMSPATARSATAEAITEFIPPIEGMLVMLATASNESLAKAAVDHRRRSFISSDLAAEITPSPSTRSLMPMVRRSNSEAPLGSSRRDRRMNGPGHAISAAPTAARSHPIRVATVGVTGAAYPMPHDVGARCRHRRGCRGLPIG